MLVCLKLLATFCGGSLMIVATLTLSHKALTPFPQPREVHPQDRRLAAENDALRLDVERLRADLAQQQADAIVWKVRAESLMKHAILPPHAEVRAEDMIPPQHLPTTAEARP